MTLSGKPPDVDLDSPYVPSGLLEQLVVGVRVRWRISPECPYKCEKCGEDGHTFGSAGEGIIQLIDDRPTLTHYLSVRDGCGAISASYNHAYGVIVDGKADEGYQGFWAAASELIPLEKAT